MPKEQQDKIDEEFEKITTSSYASPFNFDKQCKDELRTFLHSKLQEMYELGEKNRTCEITEIVNSIPVEYPAIFDDGYCDYSATYFKNEIIKRIDIIQVHTYSNENVDIYQSDINEELAIRDKIMDGLKLLQTNKK